MQLKSSSLRAAIFIFMALASHIPIAQAQNDTAPSLTFDAAQFARWRSAADHGDAAAQNKIGQFYASGIGVRQDLVEAARWFAMASEQNLAEAQFNLGTAYEKGAGVEQDYAGAAKLYRKAAVQGYAEAQKSLAVLFAQGKGVVKDTVGAYMLALLARKGTSGESIASVESLADDLARMLTDEERRKAEDLAARWKPGMPLMSAEKQ